MSQLAYLKICENGVAGLHALSQRQRAAIKYSRDSNEMAVNKSSERAT